MCISSGRRFGSKYLLAVLLLLSPIIQGHAAEIEGVEFSDSVTVDDTTLELTSLAKLYYRVIFTGAVAGLYLPNNAALDSILDDTPKRLEFVYFGSLDAGDFVKAANDTLADNLDDDKLNALRPKIDAFNELYVDIAKNDRYAITYIPGQGLQLDLNGDVLGQVEGNDFANAYFRIWFGKQPFNKHLKTALLEGSIE